MERMEGLAVAGCTRCPDLVDSRTQIVNGTGPDDADVLFVGEAPGEAEDAGGEPFVGRSGAVLDERLRANGLARADVRITNVVRCRPPDNRDPRGAELANCRGYFDAEVAAIDPAVIVTLGKVPAEHLLGRDVAVTAETGTVETVDLGGAPRDVVLSVHPAATLYDPNQRDGFARAIERAATLAGAGGQARLGDY